MRLAKMISLFLASENLTQKMAANQIGISESTLSRFLNQSSMPDAISFLKIQTWVNNTNTWEPNVNIQPNTWKNEWKDEPLC